MKPENKRNWSRYNVQTCIDNFALTAADNTCCLPSSVACKCCKNQWLIILIHLWRPQPSSAKQEDTYYNWASGVLFMDDTLLERACRCLQVVCWRVCRMCGNEGAEQVPRGVWRAKPGWGVAVWSQLLGNGTKVGLAVFHRQSRVLPPRNLPSNPARSESRHAERKHTRDTLTWQKRHVSCQLFSTDTFSYSRLHLHTPPPLHRFVRTPDPETAG